MNKITHECPICYNEKNNNILCVKCKKVYCTDCFFNILQNKTKVKCPFCRDKYIIYMDDRCRNYVDDYLEWIRKRFKQYNVSVIGDYDKSKQYFEEFVDSLPEKQKHEIERQRKLKERKQRRIENRLKRERIQYIERLISQIDRLTINKSEQKLSTIDFLESIGYDVKDVKEKYQHKRLLPKKLRSKIKKY